VANSVLADESVYSIYTEEFEPFNYLSEKQQVIGTATTKVELLFKLSNIKYKINLTPWFRTIKAVDETPNTFIYSLVRSPQREDKYHWIMPLCPLNIALFKLAERIDIKAKNLEQAKSYIIGVERNQLTVNYLLSKGFVENKNLVIVKDEKQTRGMLNKQRVDMVFATESFALSKNKKTPKQKPWELLFRVNEMSLPMYLAANRDSNAEVIEKLQRTYQKKKLTMFDKINCDQ